MRITIKLRLRKMINLIWHSARICPMTRKNTVLSLMGIDPANLANYNVTYVTNAQEHQYLDSYVDSSKIGSKSWSSVVIVKRKKEMD